MFCPGARRPHARYRWLPLLLVVVLAAAPVASGHELRLSAGATYTRGDYGTDVDIELFYFPVTARYRHGGFNARLTVPYKEIVREVGDVRVVGRGIGNVVASVGQRVLSQQGWRPQVTLTGQVRFATADSDLGLRDENVYSGQVDLARRVAHRVAVFGSLGYQTRRQSGDGYDGRAFGALGVNYDLTARTAFGVVVSGREPFSVDAEMVSRSIGYTAVPYVSFRLWDRWRLQGFGVAGLSTATPDWGAGFTLGYDF